MRLAVRGLISLLTVSATSFVAGQELLPPRTRIEAVLATKGKVIVRDSYKIGRVKGLSLEVVVVSEAGNAATKASGARIEIAEFGGRQTTHASFLDLGELEDLTRAAAQMEQTMEEWRGQRREPYSEMAFETNDDFRLGFYQDGPGPDQKVFASSGILGKADFLGGPEELSRIRELLRLAMAKLQSLGGAR
jgi:hypothetical protein